MFEKNEINLKMSKIIVENIWAEDLFQWFYDSIIEDGGDGCGHIVCENFNEVADYFVEWFKKRYDKKEFWHPKDVYEDGNTVNFHDSNENFIFSNKVPDNNKFELKYSRKYFRCITLQRTVSVYFKNLRAR